MSQRWPTVRLGEVLRYRETDVSVDAAQSYQFAGVYSFGRGVFRGQQRTGSEFAYRRLTKLRTGDFVYPKLMAWEGAFGVVPPACDGCVVSPEFPVFEIKPERLAPGFLDLYFKMPRVWSQMSGGSTGTNVRRRRLYPTDLLRAEIPLPPLAEQWRVVGRIEELAAQIHEGRTLRLQATKEAEMLWVRGASAIFGRAAEGGSTTGLPLATLAQGLSEQRFILTFDLGLGEIAAATRGSLGTVIVVRLRNTRWSHVVQRLETVLQDASADLSGAVIVTIEESRYRVRRLPIGTP